MRHLPPRRRSFRRFLAWPGCEKRAFLFSIVALPAAEISLRLLGYKRSRTLFRRKVQSVYGDTGIDPRRADQIVKSAAQITIGEDRKCLRRSLVLARILQANGFPVTVHIGFRKDGSGNLEGHAWCDVIEGTGEPQSREGQGYVRFE